MTAKYDVITVADEVLRLAKQAGMQLSPMKLMKLVYIAHGWHLVIKDSDLFANRIEAWKYGPVIPDLYHATKRFGREPIPLHLIEDEDDNVEAGTRDFLQDVLNKYGKFSAIQLSRMTHVSGSPWDQVYRDDEMGTEIPDRIIEKYYKELLNG